MEGFFWNFHWIIVKKNEMFLNSGFLCLWGAWTPLLPIMRLEFHVALSGCGGASSSSTILWPFMTFFMIVSQHSALLLILTTRLRQMGGLTSVLQPKARKQGEEKLVNSGHFVPFLVFWCMYFEIQMLLLFVCVPEHSSIKIHKYLKFLEVSVENFPCIFPIFCIKTISSVLGADVVLR